MTQNERGKASLREAEVDRLYSEEVVADIAEIIRPFVNRQAESEFDQRIRGWAGGYLVFREMDESRTLERASSKKLAALARRARVLAETIDTLDAGVVSLLAYEARTVPGPGDVPMSFLTDEAFVVDKPAIRAQLAEAQALCRTFEKLSKAHIAALSSSRGRKRDRARRIAVDALAWIFWESTGQMPTREIDRINSQPISRFHNFCVAALKPVHGEEATTGLDNIIRGSMA